MTKPTHDSVTEIPCACGTLQRLAEDSEVPVEFDQRLNEFHFTFRGGDGSPAFLMIYHCPFCGGALPESKHDSLYFSRKRDG